MPSKKTTKTTKSAKSASARAKSANKTRVKVESAQSVETFDQLAAAKAPVSRPVNRRRTIMIAAGVIILGVLLFLAYRTLILAWVDQTPITRWSYYQQLDQKYGKDLKDQLITEQLITNEAKKRNVSVSNADLDAEINKIAEQQGGMDKLNQILQLQNLTMPELRKQVSYQLLIKKMFSSDANVTDDEVNKYMTDNKSQFPQVTDEVKAQVKDQLALQKVSTAFNAWLTQAKSSNRIIQY